MPPGAATTSPSQPSSVPSSNPPTWSPRRPNILLTGTPGVGKTTLARHLSTQLGLRHIDVSDFARDRDHLGEPDPRRHAHYIHEDAVLDDLEPIMTDGAVVLDHHSCDWFPERWFQLAVVLRASTAPLYDRLEARGYAPEKVAENVQAEIMQVVFEEAVSSYPRLDVVELANDTDPDRERNLSTIKSAWNSLNRSGNTPHVDIVDGHRV